MPSARHEAVSHLADVIVNGVGRRTDRKIEAERVELGDVTRSKDGITVELHRSDETMRDSELWWPTHCQPNTLDSDDVVLVVAMGSEFLVLGAVHDELDDDDDKAITSERTGAMMLWREGVDRPPGWIRCNGGSFSASTYPRLRALWDSTSLPDDPGIDGCILIVRAR